MKVFSLTEPYATLIKEKKKHIETRSFKTNYRGELYIHASATKIPKEWREDKRLMSLVDSTSLSFGHIICKCNLVDCIYMTKEYVEYMKEHCYLEYICGKYEEGRYAWILEDITPLETPIKAKGQLNIWNYYSAVEIMDLMKDITYGFIAQNAKQYTSFDEAFQKKYRLQSPKETIENKIGTCWDQVELERYYFKGNDWNIKTYFIVHYDGDKCPTHTFLTFEKEGQYSWFEHAWEKFRGVHEYASLKELLLDVREKFILYELQREDVGENLVLYEYKKPKYHLTVQEFFLHCEQGKRLDFEKLK